jgi:hypothetical protein
MRETIDLYTEAGYCIIKIRYYKKEQDINIDNI